MGAHRTTLAQEATLILAGTETHRTRWPGHAEANGEALAVTLAAAIGCFALGLLINLTELSTTFREWMLIHDEVGPLSGKTTYATIVFFAAWVVLHLLWKDRELDFRRVMFVAGILLVVAFILDWPPFFEWVAEEFGPE